MTEFDVQEGFLRAAYPLTSAISNMRYYGCDHPYVVDYVQSAFGELTSLLGTIKSITVFLVGDRLIVEDRPLAETRLFIKKFISILKENEIERLTFAAGITKLELMSFIAGLAAKGGTPLRSSTGIRLGKVELRMGEETWPLEACSIPAGERPTTDVSLIGGDQEFDRIKELYQLAERNKRVDMHNAEEIVKRFIGILGLDADPIGLLASVKEVHEYTFTHAVNVGILTIGQARILGFSSASVREIGIAALLHDMGKIFIPPEILGKPGRLTPQERVVIEKHTLKGGRYLMTQEGVPKLAALVALEHHRKFDGTGYPYFGPGWKPHIVGQMVAIADVFDALRSRRAYSEPKSMEAILEILRQERGIAFHPRLLDNFLGLLAGHKPPM
ncbi:MAG: HD domain-containing protein [Candidatus Aminicenantes bacterium]|nr:HD domain-containing protein [Candidatus Aminicenantes bacterium]